MKLIKIKNTQFQKLLETFIVLLKEKSYKDYVVDNYRRTLAKIDLYMQDNEIKRYTPEVGICYCAYYVKQHQTGKSRTAAIQTAVGRLNDFLLGKEYRVQRLYHDTAALPNDYEDAVRAYEQICHESGNKNNTVFSKCQKVRSFLWLCVELGYPDVSSLLPSCITRACLMFTNKEAWAPIRAFLKFLCVNGSSDIDFSTVVPHYSRSVRLPVSYSVEVVRKIESAIDRNTKIGKRDYAMILLASRLGMRSGDIVLLCKNNIDFGSKWIGFTQQKTGERIRLPLLSEVEGALKDYLLNARPVSLENRIFLRCNAPFEPVTTSVLRFETTKYFKVAGIDIEGRKHGPHAFRSSLATSLVNVAVPYEAIRKILGHTDPDAVKHYAKLDVERLRLYAVEVPEATGFFKRFLEGGRVI